MCYPTINRALSQQTWETVGDHEAFQDKKSFVMTQKYGENGQQFLYLIEGTKMVGADGGFYDITKNDKSAAANNHRNQQATGVPDGYGTHVYALIGLVFYHSLEFDANGGTLADGSVYNMQVYNGSSKGKLIPWYSNLDKSRWYSDIDVAALGQKVEVEFNGTKLKGDENSEAKILTFTIDNPIILEQPVIDETTHTITFKVSDEATKEDLSALKPQFTISEKATVSPVSGVAQNFSDGKTVTYTVIAENGTTVEYSVSISMKGQIFGFEDWVAGVEGQEPDMTFYEPVGWASSNTGAHFLKAFSLADSYVVMETNDAHSGEKAALIKSIDTKGQDLYLAKAPKVTTGTLFLGKFITDIANTLNSTKFGIPYSNKPISVKGWYKYTPGEKFYVCEAPYSDNCHNSTLDESKQDQFSINAVLYTTDEYDTEEWSDCLTGVPNDNDNNILESSRVAAIATISGGAQAEWKEFEIRFEYKKEFDPNQKYRLSIAFTSSKDGDKFWGAPGSELIVDDIELVVE